jgi:hypothetical protein
MSATAEFVKHPAAGYINPATKHTNAATKHVRRANNEPTTAFKHTADATKRFSCAVNDPRPHIKSAHPHLSPERSYIRRWILHHHLHSGH